MRFNTVELKGLNEGRKDGPILRILFLASKERVFTI